jgi:serine/threonine protein phosphatase PrpC
LGRSKAHAVKLLSSHCSVFAVFDGHNGPLAAEHLVETLIETLHARLPRGRPPRRQGCCLSDSGERGV